MGGVPAPTYRPHDAHDALPQQPRINVIGALPPALRGTQPGLGVGGGSHRTGMGGRGGGGQRPRGGGVTGGLGPREHTGPIGWKGGGGTTKPGSGPPSPHRLLYDDGDERRPGRGRAVQEAADGRDPPPEPPSHRCPGPHGAPEVGTWRAGSTCCAPEARSTETRGNRCSVAVFRVGTVGASRKFRCPGAKDRRFTINDPPSTNTLPGY